MSVVPSVPPPSFHPPPAPSPWPSNAPPPRSGAGRLWLKLMGGIVGGLTIGLAIGIFAGRFVYERQWSPAPVVISSADESRSASQEADPTPKAGTTVLRATPIGKARAALKTITANDTVVATVVSIGAGEDGIELHVTIENRGKCKVTSASGVAYGFDARGRSAAMNKHGEHYVAFDGAKLTLEPGAHTMIALKLRYAGDSTLGAAHVDAWTCADGTSWKRK